MSTSQCRPIDSALRDHARDRLGVQRRIADDPALAHPSLADLELRFHECDDRRTAGERRDRTGSTVRSEMNERSATTRSDRADTGRVNVADVGSLEHGHPLILTQRPRELSAADVECHDRARAALQQAVREATGRRADVETSHTGDIDPERVQRRRRASRHRARRSALLAPPSSIGSASSTIRSGFVAMRPDTITLPSITASRARLRESARPRRTSSASSRRRVSCPLFFDADRGLRAGAFRGFAADGLGVPVFVDAASAAPGGPSSSDSTRRWSRPTSSRVAKPSESICRLISFWIRRTRSSLVARRPLRRGRARPSGCPSCASPRAARDRR